MTPAPLWRVLLGLVVLAALAGAPPALAMILETLLHGG